MNVVATRTGVEHHASNDNVKTLCGRKATAKFGPVGTPVETQPMNADGSYGASVFLPAAVTCEKCLSA